MVEKMGHKKMMQTARMEWINEGKPRSSVHEDSIFNEPAIERGKHEGRGKTAPRIASIFEKATTERPKTPAGDELDDLFGDNEDIYNATPKAASGKQVEGSISQTDSLFGGGASIFGTRKETSNEEEFPEDDLDALLAEEELMRNAPKPTAISKPIAPPDDFDDEMDAMQGLDW
jgi:replication fork protection complex subunit Csm3/Swi3